MSLQAGAQIGPFVITGKLGAGGMGEMHRARDGKLNRDVAIKALPDASAQDRAAHHPPELSVEALRIVALYTAAVSQSSRAPSVVVNRSAVVVQSLHDEPDDRRWWWTRPVAERLAAIEIMRRTVYGRAATDGRLQRVLEITQREPR
jgi:serine/threonine protein kinase